MAIAENGKFTGSVSGGCIEGAVVTAALELAENSGSKLLHFGVSDESAWGIGLSCGGEIEILLCPVSEIALLDQLIGDIVSNTEVALLTRLADGSQQLGYREDKNTAATLGHAEYAQMQSLLQAGRCGMIETAQGSLFVRSYVPVPQLLIVGAVHITQALADMAKAAGFRVVVIDPRKGFARPEKFPGVELKHGWPDRVLAEYGLDGTTAVVTLTHDSKIDDPALVAALNSQAFYIGALGSKRTHARRLERLSEKGLADETPRIHGPVGLDLGGRSPGEIAVAIMAQIIQARYV